MIVPRIYTAVGVYQLTNVSENAAASLVLQTRLSSGTGITWALRKRVSGSTVADSAAPRTAFSNACTGAAVDSATAVTATTAAQIHSVICDGCDVLLEILTNTGSGVLQVDMAPVTGGT